ncbi:hypothetical protein [Micromonospora sp. CB01531]|uniref:hypothetical protein n=1 Tax=Micromonospora sp. CB01531 TaxID=1718947 RepID=UPI0011615378|nr:hypothetical protein [Micromonospora sp. CB01531]
MREDTGRQQVSGSAGQPSGTGEAPMIDLDAPSRQAQPPLSHQDPLRHPWRSFRSARVPLPLVLALLVGAGAVAGVGTYQWQARQQRLADESAAAVLVLGKNEVAGGEREGSLVRAESSVIVVNHGPLPVEVTDIRASKGDLGLSSVRSDVVRPGAQSFSVRLTLNCTARVPNEPVPVVISVRTEDGTTRQVTSRMAATPWQFAFNGMCEQLPR